MLLSTRFIIIDDDEINNMICAVTLKKNISRRQHQNIS